MSYAYLHAAGPSCPPSSYMYDKLPPWGKLLVAILQSWVAASSYRVRKAGGPRGVALGAIQRMFTVANAVILLWIAVLWWGERTVFRQSVENCVWDGWEKWVYAFPFLPFRCLLIIFVYIATICHSASCCLHCGSATGRCSYLSRSSLAPIDAHGQIHGPVLATVILADPGDPGARFRALPGRSV